MAIADDQISWPEAGSSEPFESWSWPSRFRIPALDDQWSGMKPRAFAISNWGPQGSSSLTSAKDK